MKKISALIAVAACAVMSLVACKKDSAANNPTTPAGHNVHAVAKIGYSSTVATTALCSGYSSESNCRSDYGKCAWCVTDAAYLQLANQMPVQLMLSDDNTKLLVRYQRPLTDMDDVQLDLQNETDVPAAVCQALQTNAIHILPGVYNPEYDENQNGDYELNVTVQKP